MSDPTISVQSLQLENAALRQRIAELEREQADRACADVTAQQAQAAQSKTAEQLRAAQHLAVLGSWEWDLHAQALTWSDEVYRIFGVTPGELAPSTEAFESFIHPEDRGDFLRRRAEMLAEHRTAIIDHRIIRRDGAVRYVQERAQVLTNVTGDASRVIGTVQDITERKCAEIALADREAGLREEFKRNQELLIRAQQIGHLGSWMWDVGRQALTWSDELYRIFGVSHDFELTYGGIEAMLHPEDRAHNAEQVQQLVSSAVEQTRYEFRIIRPDGEVRHIEQSMEVTRDETGATERVFGIMQDITEHTQIEEALRASERNYRELINGMNETVWVIDFDGNLIDVNKTAVEVFGYSREELLTVGLEGIDASLKKEDIKALAKAMPVDRVQVFETSHRTKDGRAFPVEVCSSLVTYGGKRSILSIARDITARKQAEAVQRSLYDALNASLNEIYIFDAQTLRFEFVSTGALNNLGYSPDELRQMTPIDLKPGYTAEAFADLIAPLRRGTASIIEFETVHRRANGSQYPVEVHLQLSSQTGHPVFLAVILDITARKQTEEALSQTLADLRRSNADLQQFAYVASHDLREPLRMVGSFVQLLGERYGGQLDADADDFIGFAVDGVQRMERLINDLLDYSRLGTLGEPFRPTDAGAALDEALWNLELALTDAGATVTHDPLPTVLADPIQLTQVFQNLISNAIKFHGAVPPRVHVSVRPLSPGESRRVGDRGKNDPTTPPLTPSSTRPAAPCWLFSVRDNGIGIDPRDHERIFGIFQRLHTQGEYPGTGIGLPMCQRIVERHGGRIWVESQLGQGATFFFTLPAS